MERPSTGSAATERGLERAVLENSQRRLAVCRNRLFQIFQCFIRVDRGCFTPIIGSDSSVDFVRPDFSRLRQRKVADGNLLIKHVRQKGLVGRWQGQRLREYVVSRFHKDFLLCSHLPGIRSCGFRFDTAVCPVVIQKVDFLDKSAVVINVLNLLDARESVTGLPDSIRPL
jgi:hypothetical protein